MKKANLFRTLLLMLFLPGALSSQTADDIIAKNIEIRGGRQKLSSIKTIRCIGTFTQGSLKAKMIADFKSPDKFYLKLEIGKIEAKIGYDGETLWKQNPGGFPKEMPKGSDALTVALAENHPFLLAHGNKPYRFELVAQEFFEGAEIYKIKATPQEGDIIYGLIHKENHLGLGFFLETPAGAKDSFYFRDYKETGGILFPYSMEARKSNGEITDIKFDHVECNVDIDDAEFGLPSSRSEIKTQGQGKGDSLRDYRYKVPERVEDGWETASLTDAGMKAEPLIHLMNNLLNRNDHFIHSLLVIKNGKLIFEEYFKGRDLVVNEGTLNKIVSPGGELETREQPFDRDTLHFQASVTKSLTSLLLGIALDQKWIRSIGDKMSSFFPEYSGLLEGEKDAITVKHMLSMSSGIPWSEKYPYNDSRNFLNQLLAADDPKSFVLGLKLIASPGQAFNYNSGTTILLGEIIRRASGKNLKDVAKDFLFAPLGITDFQMVNLPKAQEIYFASSGLFLRPRDMAKIGQLVLQEGLWGKKRIVSASWIRESVEKSIGLPSSNSLPYFADGYGYQWWLGHFSSKNIRAYAAAGFGDQFIVVLPEIKMVVVLTGGDWNGRSPFLVYDFVINKHILSALE